MHAWAVIVAAGKGERLLDATGGVSKQFLEWRGEPLYAAFARTFAHCGRAQGIVFVFPAAEVEARSVHAAALSRDIGIPVRCVAGGARRQDSVRNGLMALPEACDTVLVHDAARPFASAALVNRVLDALADGAQGVIPAIPVVDTIKIVHDGTVVSTPERAALRAVQTPQGFGRAVLLAAHERAEAEQMAVTDDASILEACGIGVRVVDGETGNIKITRPEDLTMLGNVSASPAAYRTGYGYDVHAYCDPETPSARPLRLGGVLIDGGFTVRAHSDGDVLLHALTDAILGCIGVGDIGQLFPDKDPAFDNASSSALRSEVLDLARRKGFTLTHADVTVIAQKPAVSPHRAAIRANLARLLGLPKDAVNVKATTEEKLGFTGELKGLKSVAVVGGIMTPSAS
jgi:2-C-methyl-D-erythritol 4-phosphate cytidylyltransferase/2-C-methyl-D-erythritol 2,4-cyclodiphosphate synthase